MSAAAKAFTGVIVEGALDMASTAALMNDRSLNLSDPEVRAVASYISTATIAYLNHLAERYDATEEIAAFYQKVGAGLTDGAA